MDPTRNKSRPPSAQAAGATTTPAWLRAPGAVTAIGTITPWLLAGAAVLCAASFAIAFAPGAAEHVRGSVDRIVFIHVPSTWTALLLYALLVFWAALRLLTGLRMASMMVEAIAPTGALFALLTLWTGSLWSKAISDLWWDWDARRLADLALLFFFVVCSMLREALDDGARADAVTAVLALLGGLVVVSVLHSVNLVPGDRSHPQAGGDLAIALAAVTAAFMVYATAAALKRLRCVILEHERSCEWIAHWKTGR